jgi:hypothetical protein
MENEVEGISMEHITGNDPKLQFQRHIGGGGFGRVYCVYILWPFQADTLL